MNITKEGTRRRRRIFALNDKYIYNKLQPNSTEASAEVRPNIAVRRTEPKPKPSVRLRPKPSAKPNFGTALVVSIVVVIVVCV